MESKENIDDLKREVYRELSRIQKLLKVSKDHKNTRQNYMYWKREDILDGIKSVMGEHFYVYIQSEPYLVPLDESVEKKDAKIVSNSRVYIKSVVVFGKDGFNIEIPGFAREELYDDYKAQSQITGSSTTYSSKYGLANAFALGTDDDPDENVEVKKKTNNIKPTPKTTNESKMKTVDEIFADIIEPEDNKSVVNKPSEAQIGMFMKTLIEAANLDEKEKLKRFQTLRESVPGILEESENLKLNKSFSKVNLVNSTKFDSKSFSTAIDILNGKR